MRFWSLPQRIIEEIDGPAGEKYFDEYADSNSERYKEMVGRICKSLNLTTLGYNSLDVMLGAIGIDKCKLCTYCWTGKE